MTLYSQHTTALDVDHSSYGPQRGFGMSEKCLYTRTSTIECTYWGNKEHTAIVLVYKYLFYFILFYFWLSSSGNGAASAPVLGPTRCPPYWCTSVIVFPLY